MTTTIGVLAAEHIVVGLVYGVKLGSSLRLYPEKDGGDALQGMSPEEICRHIVAQIGLAAGDAPFHTVGVGFPGIVRDGLVEESPNLQQVKGANLKALLETELRTAGVTAQVSVFNRADAIAAGIAATRGDLDKLTRVWTLGNGIGYGRYPAVSGVWEGGHAVVSLDPKERFCGCGGVGHLEGIMGERAMRLRFLDREPHEIFEAASAGDARCAEFARLWHRALAAATATNIHLDGPGKFFITGPNSRFINLALLNQYLEEMVKMSPLQGYVFQLLPASDEIAVIGAAVNAANRGLTAAAPAD